MKTVCGLPVVTATVPARRATPTGTSYSACGPEPVVRCEDLCRWLSGKSRVEIGEMAERMRVGLSDDDG